MTDPLIEAVEVWLVFYRTLPAPILSLHSLVFFLMLAFFIVRLLEAFVK